jgi:hypothetical protein
MRLKITWNNGDVEKVNIKTTAEAEGIRLYIKENFSTTLIFIGEEGNEHTFIYLASARKVEILE